MTAVFRWTRISLRVRTALAGSNAKFGYSILPFGISTKA